MCPLRCQQALSFTYLLLKGRYFVHVYRSLNSLFFRNKRPAIPKTTLLAANKNYHTRKINTFYLWHCPINQSKKEKGTGWPQITCSSHDQIRPLLTHGGKHLCPNDFELEAGKKKASNLESGEEAIENSRSWH
jgi:hypothetical protein